MSTIAIPAQGADNADLIALATQARADMVAVETTANSAIGAVKRTVTIDKTSDAFSGLSGGVQTFSKSIGAVLPASARLLGYSVGEGSFTAFDDATHGTYGLEIGTSGTPDLIQLSLDVAAGQTGFPKAGNKGVQGYTMALHASEQLVCKITSSVDLNTVTAGHVVINVFYVPLA